MKVCSKCGIEKDESEFHKDRTKKDGLHTICKECRKKFCNTEVKAVYDKKWYAKNRDKKLAYSRKWKEDNKEKRKEYLLENKKRIKKQEAEYRKNNKHIRKAYLESPAKFSTYKHQLTIDEAPILAKDGVSLEVKCRYCGKYFIPKTSQVIQRVSALKVTCDGTGECFIYCSDNCKEACPVYKRIKHPKGFKKASSREVNSLVRQLVFERDSWVCQKCNKNMEEVELHCHHIKSYTHNKILGNDIDNCITLCKECHKDVHMQDGCKYHELKCKN